MNRPPNCDCPKCGAFVSDEVALIQADNTKLRGIIARATAERLDGREGCHITREDVEASLEILYAEQKGRKTK